MHCNRDRQMLRSATGSVKNAMKAKIENIYTIALALLILVTTMMDPYISFGISATFLAASAIYEFVEGQKRERGYLNG